MQTSGSPGDPARARSFGAAAATYHRARTGYTDEEVVWALGGVDVAGLDVLDLAAGTGRLTLALLAAGVGAAGGSLHAVEPDPAMRAEFARQVPADRATLHDGTAETIPLPDASVDAVVAGSAFHWFDPPRALPEIARVLRPGGTLTALWTHPDEQVGWVRGYRTAGRVALAAGGRPAQVGDPAADPTGDRHATADFRHSDIPASALFTPTELRQSVHVERTTREVVTEAIGTYSEVLVRDAASRDAVLAAVAAALDEVVPGGAADAADATVDLPVRVQMARCRRR